MTSVCLVGDLHLSDRSPVSCTPQYNDQLFTMLREVVDLSNSVDAVVFSGDVFHAKAPHRTSHRTVQRMIDVVQAFPCPVLLVPGNHDMQQDRLASIHETQPFGTLLQAGARLLIGWADGFPIYGVPWLQSWEDAAPAFRAWDEAPFDSVVDSGNYLLVAHAPIYPPGRENPFECVAASQVSEWMLGNGYCYYGHVHDHHGTFTVDGVTFCNQGALSRGSLQEEDLTRRPAVTYWHSDRSGVAAFERVELTSAPPADQVFRVAEAAQRVDHRDRLEDFLAAVGRAEVAQTSVEAVLAHIGTLGLAAPERALAEDVLRSAEAGELR